MARFEDREAAGGSRLEGVRVGPEGVQRLLAAVVAELRRRRALRATEDLFVVLVDRNVVAVAGHVHGRRWRGTPGSGLGLQRGLGLEVGRVGVVDERIDLVVVLLLAKCISSNWKQRLVRELSMKCNFPLRNVDNSNNHAGSCKSHLSRRWKGGQKGYVFGSCVWEGDYTMAVAHLFLGLRAL